jgi:proteic killer suppression protein
MPVKKILTLISLFAGSRGTLGGIFQILTKFLNLFFRFSLCIWCVNRIYLSLALVTIVVIMILTFGDKETELIWSGIRVKNMPLEIQNFGRRKLRMLNNSQTINDLRIPPSNRLEKLNGNLDGFYSIRINDQWRIIFRWIEGQSEHVKIIDYH